MQPRARRHAGSGLRPRLCQARRFVSQSINVRPSKNAEICAKCRAKPAALACSSTRSFSRGAPSGAWAAGAGSKSCRPAIAAGGALEGGTCAAGQAAGGVCRTAARGEGPQACRAAQGLLGGQTGTATHAAGAMGASSRALCGACHGASDVAANETARAPPPGAGGPGQAGSCRQTRSACAPAGQRPAARRGSRQGINPTAAC